MISNGVHLQRDIERARFLGIEMKKGWRKKLLSLDEIPEEITKKAASNVACRNLGMSLYREKEHKIGCRYQLHPEFTMVEKVFIALVNKGYECHLEVRVPSIHHESGTMRIDIGIFKNDCLIHAIEVKREGKALSGHTRQAKAYQDLNDSYGVGIHFVNHESHIQKLFERIQF